MSSTAFIKVAFFDLGKTLVGDNKDWIPGAKDTLAKLVEKHIRLGVISNTGDLSRSKILDLLPKDFDLDIFEENLIIFSSEVDVEKPDPKIFQLAIQRANVKASECFFCTEERPHVLAAQKEGMRACTVQKPPGSDIKELVHELTASGLLPA